MILIDYFISDLHFGHHNILTFDQRQFQNTDEMEREIVRRWNERVTKQDTVYILGDFCWSADEKEWVRLLDMLNGSKVLIRGNHDLKNPSNLLKRQFADIKDYKEITSGQKHIIMSHYPILLYKSAYNPDCIMLCGHVHTTRENDFLVKWREELRSSKKHQGDNCGNVFNVGCMLPYMDYTPRTLDEILESSGVNTSTTP